MTVKCVILVLCGLCVCFFTLISVFWLLYQSKWGYIWSFAYSSYLYIICLLYSCTLSYLSFFNKVHILFVISILSTYSIAIIHQLSMKYGCYLCLFNYSSIISMLYDCTMCYLSVISIKYINQCNSTLSVYSINMSMIFVKYNLIMLFLKVY